MLKIAIFPDSLTHYRVPVFNSLASIKGVQIDVYATNGSRLPDMQAGLPEDCRFRIIYNQARSEEHTSELQSRGHLVCRLLIEKKNKYISFKSINPIIRSASQTLNFARNVTTNNYTATFIAFSKH